MLRMFPGVSEDVNNEIKLCKLEGRAGLYSKEFMFAWCFRGEIS